MNETFLDYQGDVLFFRDRKSAARYVECEDIRSGECRVFDRSGFELEVRLESIRGVCRVTICSGRKSKAPCDEFRSHVRRVYERRFGEGSAASDIEALLSDFVHAFHPEM